MPRYLKVNIICILFLIFTVPVSSELYQYKDENGIMRLTDDIYSVPTKDRLQLETFSEFESPSEALEILPIQNKSLAQTKEKIKTKKQTKPEKVIVPKTAKTISAMAEIKIISPDIPPDAEKKTASKSKKQTPSPFQAIIPEKVVIPEKAFQTPDTKIYNREIYKSKKITIERTDKIVKKVSVQKTAPLKASKNLQKISKPTAIPKTVAESQRIYKDKTAKIIPEKPNTKKKPETQKKTVLKIKTKKQEQPKKIAVKKPALKSKTNTEIQKAIKSKDVITDQKTVPPAKAAQAGPKKAIPKKETTKPVAPQKTVKAAPVVEPSKNIPDISKKTVPVIKKASTDNHDPAVAKKDVTSLIIAPKKDQNKLAEIEKSNIGSREITSNEPGVIKDSGQTGNTTETVTTNKMIENVTKGLNKKDESLILAQLQTTRKLLAGKKEALNKKFQDLMKEKQKLEDSVDEDDEKSVIKYNENVKKLNIKIKQYKKHKKILQAKIDKYNHTVKQSGLN